MSGALFCGYVAFNDLSIKICVFLKRRPLGACSHHLLRPLVPRSVGGPVGLWGALLGPRAAPSTGSPKPSGSAACSVGRMGLQAADPEEKRHEPPCECLFTSGQIRAAVEADLVVSRASGDPSGRGWSPGPRSRLRGIITAFPSCCPSPRQPGQPDPGPDPSWPGSPPATPQHCPPDPQPGRRPPVRVLHWSCHPTLRHQPTSPARPGLVRPLKASLRSWG